MMARAIGKGDILDHPFRLGGETIVAWVWNGVQWPDGRRQTLYLSNQREDVMKGYALFESMTENAQTFATLADAHEFVAEHEKRRGVPYNELRITTIAELCKIVGYPE
jgi:hypothetical protein